MARPMTYLLAFAITFGMFASDAVAHPNDAAATKAYLRAEYKSYRAIDDNLETSRKDLKSFVGQVVAGCPNVLAGFPQEDAKLPNLIEEELAALAAVAERPDLHAELVFARSVSHLRWTNRVLGRLVKQYNEKAPTISAASLCADYTTWAASGYRTLSSHSQIFLRRMEAKEKRNEVMGSKGSEGPGKAIKRLLVPYERASGRKLAKQVYRLEAQLEDASLELILGAAGEMDKGLGLPPLQKAAPA
ncbi:MAG TPA: hypothetical protein VHY18_03895 [Solirubrobacteraceae bacterium]|jgi:hypothetical protein|nr:hypothetical protein [Solirubrobacteraceae bacterium]